MKVGDAEAEACAGLKATGRCVHADGGRGEGVIGREHERTPVLATIVGRVGRAGEDVVPLEDVLLRWVGNDVGRRGLGYGGVLARETLGCGGRGHGSWCAECERRTREGNSVESRPRRVVSDFTVVAGRMKGANRCRAGKTSHFLRPASRFFFACRCAQCERTE